MTVTPRILETDFLIVIHIYKYTSYTVQIHGVFSKNYMIVLVHAHVVMTVAFASILELEHFFTWFPCIRRALCSIKYVNHDSFIDTLKLN